MIKLSYGLFPNNALSTTFICIITTKIIIGFNHYCDDGRG